LTKITSAQYNQDPNFTTVSTVALDKTNITSHLIQILQNPRTNTTNISIWQTPNEKEKKHENAYPSTSRGGYQDPYSIPKYLVQLSLSVDCWPNFETLVG
jgi:hypothetical protein